jgi:hypothetical protein
MRELSASASFGTISSSEPTMGISACRFLSISAGSTSMWITLAPGAKTSSLPVTRSSKRAPHAIRRSALFMAQLAAFDPCMPGRPMQSGCESGKTPFAIRVVMTGICTASATRISSSGSTLAEIAPPPT